MSPLLLTTTACLSTLAVGWFLGGRVAGSRTSRKGSPTGRRLPSLTRDYFIGLNYLLNEQSDKAVDFFIRVLQVDDHTVETHLALGKLFRRRGEVDRAIRIHQNLISRPQLTREQRVQSLLELGRDYTTAGLLDRAEGLFNEVVKMGERVDIALKCLLDIFEQEKSWQKAINTAHKLLVRVGDVSKTSIAHYYCELAIEAWKQREEEEAFRQLKWALGVDRHCVRASLLMGQWLSEQGDYRYALKRFRQVVDQDPEYLSEVVSPIVECYKQLQDEKGLFKFLQSCVEQYPRISVVLAAADHLRANDRIKESSSLIVQFIKQYPSLRGLDYLIEMHLETTEGKPRANLEILHSLVKTLLKDKPVYRCIHCGFAGKLLHWQCPSCKHWSSVKPIHGLEGD